MIPVQPFLPWKISIAALHGLAIFSTCLRLEHRRRTRRLWWDDYAAIVPILSEGPNMAVLWLRFRHGPVSTEDRVLFSYMNQFLYNTINWWSRISLALAVLRITPNWAKTRNLVIGMPIAFMLCWISLCVGMIATCAIHTEWQSSSSEIMTCGPSYQVTIASTVYALGDISLIGIPLHQLWRISRRASERRLVRLVFSASAITLVSSLLFCAFSYGGFLIGPGSLMVWLMACYVATAVSIITSNLLVLICWFRHCFPTDEGPIEVSDIHITPHWSRGHQDASGKESTSNGIPVLATSQLEVTDAEQSGATSLSGQSGEEMGN